MASLGDLERTVMNYLWDSPEPCTATEVRDSLAENSDKEVAVTTMLTVLSRLEKKELVRRERTGRPHRYSPTLSRAEHTATLMTEALGSAHDSDAVLARFIGSVSPEEAATLRRLLES